MIPRGFSAVRSIAHTCSGFGSYLMHLQSDCLKRRGNGDCEGSPTAEEAQRDYKDRLLAYKKGLLSGI